MKAARQMLVLMIAMGLAAIPLRAHEMTVRLEPPGEQRAWYPIDDKTKVKQGKETLKLAEAKIAVDERVVLIVDRPSRGPMPVVTCLSVARGPEKEQRTMSARHSGSHGPKRLLDWGILRTSFAKSRPLSTVEPSVC